MYNKNNADRKNRFSIRKLSVGAISVMIATIFYLGAGTPVQADETPNDVSTNTVVENTGNQTDSTTNSEENSKSGEISAETVTEEKSPEVAANVPATDKAVESPVAVEKKASPKLENKSMKPATSSSTTADGFIDIADATGFTDALANAKTDGTETNLRLTNDIDLGNTKIEILSGQNIHITNDQERRTIYLGDQWFVQNGAQLFLEGSYDEATGQTGLAITRPQRENPQTDLEAVNKPTDEKGWITWLNKKRPEAPIVINGHANFTNVDVYDFYSAGGGKGLDYVPGGTVLVTGKDANLDLAGHTQVRDNVLFGTFRTFWQQFNYSAGVNYYVQPETSDKATGNIGPDVVFKNNKVKFGEISDLNGRPSHDDPGVPMAAGALAISRGSSVNITGTTFENNNGGYYGAIMIGGRYNILTVSYYESAIAHVNIHGAKIINNTGAVSGGGITIMSHSDVLIDGDTLIANNKVGYLGDELLNNSFAKINGRRMGGGISISEDPVDARTPGYDKVTNLAHVVIDGAIIDGNTSADVGGGIYVNTDGLEIKKATISNNTAFSQGGGIYLSAVPYNLHMSNAVIYENTAKPLLSNPLSSTQILGSGGGVWVCPTGDTVIDVTNGWAVFDNLAESLGDDFYHEELNANVQVSVHSRALGGSDTNWTHDRDNLDGKKLESSDILDDAGLKSHLSESAKELAKKLATIHIFGNTASYGGGVGGNGGIYSGFTPEDLRTRQIEIKKVWSDKDKQTPDSVVIDVFVTLDGKQYQVTSFELNKENNWTYTLSDLPIGIKYSFVEQKVDLDNDGNADWIQDKDTVEEKDAEAESSELVITNIWNNTTPPTPKEPKKPVEPNKPTEPETPVTPDQPAPEIPTTPEI